MKVLYLIIAFGLGVLLYWFPYYHGVNANPELHELAAYRQALMEVYVPDPTIERHITRNYNLKEKDFK